MKYSFLAVVTSAPDNRRRLDALDNLVSKLRDKLVERIFRDEFSDRS